MGQEGVSVGAEEGAAGNRAPPRQQWNPRDYVTRGVFCPLADVQAALDRLVEEPQIEYAAMICADRGAILRSLCMCSPADEEGPREFVAMLEDASVHRRPRLKRHALQDLVRSMSSGREAFRFPASRDKIVQLLIRIAEARAVPAVAKMMRNGRWLAVPTSIVSDSSRVDTAIMVRVAAEATPPDRALLEKLADTLIVRVHGTAQADIRRDTSTMSRLRERLQQTRPQDEFAKGAERLVAVAADVSETGEGACYLASPAGTVLRCIASYPPPHRSKLGLEFPPQLEIKAPFVAAAAVRLQRTIQMPPGIEWERDLHPTIGTSSRTGLVELSIPIPGPMATPNEPAIGVLTVVKPDVARPHGEVTAFGAYDLARLRNVALRLALLNANSRASALISAGFALSERATEAAPPAAASGDRQQLPSDLEAAHPNIERGLKALAEHTHSHSATFRAVLPYSETGHEHGTALVRIASITPAEDQEQFRVQTFEKGGYNWSAVLTGKVQNHSNVGAKSDYQKHREHSRSQLALPVRVEGRVIGVINLESPQESAYDAFEYFAETFAFRAGLAIADARLEGQTALHQQAVEIVNRSHALSNQIKELMGKKLITENERSEELEAELKRLRRLAKELRTGPEEKQAPAFRVAGTLPELLDEAIEAARLKIHRREDDRAIAWRPYDHATATIVAQLLHNLLDNIKWHADPAGAEAEAWVSRGTWGGREEDLIILQNKPGMRIGEAVTRNLYKFPQQKTGRTGKSSRLGAFLSGRLARSLNGDIYGVVLPNGHLRTTVAIPSSAQHRGLWKAEATGARA
jgi:GAF domain-containing protein